MKNEKITLIMIHFVRILFVVIAAWQIIGLFPVLTWFSAFAQVTGDMWVTVGIKSAVLGICLFAYFRLDRVGDELRYSRTSVMEDKQVKGTLPFN